MNAALRQIVTYKPPEIPNSVKSSLVAYYSGQHRDGVYYPMTNIIVNGNFTGTAGWSAYNNSQITASDNILTHTASANNVSTGATQSAKNYIIGNKYYARGALRVTNALATQIKIRFAAGWGDLIVNSPTENTWYELSRVFTATTGGSFIDEVSQTYESTEIANGKIAEFKNISCLNLTAIFGTGNEPTAAEMDAILAADGTAYWDGTRNVLCNPNQQYFWADYSGNSRHGKLSNFAYAPGSTLDQYGAYIDGVDDYISIADSAATRLTAGGTLWAWIKPGTTLGESNGGRIFDKSTDAVASNGYRLNLSTGNKAIFEANDGAITTSADNAFPSGVWRFLSATFNGNGRHMYANAIDVTALYGTATVLPPDVAGTVCIGNRAGATDRTFDGQIGLCGMANRALTASEIKYLFDSTRRRYGV